MATRQSERFRIAILASVVLLLAFTLSAPDRVSFWVALVIAAIGFGPYFGRGRRGFLSTRLVAFSIGAPLFFAFGVSSPGHAAFWVVFVATTLIVLPIAAVSVHFLMTLARGSSLDCASVREYPLRAKPR